MVKTLLILILAVAGLTGPLKRINQEWLKLGAVTIDFKDTESEILVLKSEVFTSMKFRVISSPVILSSIEIYYETGENQHIDLNLTVEPGKDSRAIELTGGERKLVKAVVQYKKPLDSRSEKASIQLWGLKKGGT